MLGATGSSSGARAGLGLEARQRRARIDARSRDDKRSVEGLLAKRKLARRNEKVITFYCNPVAVFSLATAITSWGAEKHEYRSVTCTPGPQWWVYMLEFSSLPQHAVYS